MIRSLASGLLLAASSVAIAGDPFVDVQPMVSEPSANLPVSSWRDNLLFRKEIYWLEAGGVEDFKETDHVYSRISVGFEIQKRFATVTKTVGSFDYQGRVVYRSHVLDTAADPMGMEASRWEYETHNAYVDFYNVWGEPGRFNLRAGRFYQPFGLHFQTDTHGQLLHLSNGRVFGTDHDWQMTAYGNATAHLDYRLGYVLGTGPDQELDGQAGMAAGRLGLGQSVMFSHGLEGGVSGAIGERLDPHVDLDEPIQTWRAGADVRKRFDTALGPITLTGEAAAGEDNRTPVWSGMAQADWLHPSRRWGGAAQYFYFDRNPEESESAQEEPPGSVDERVILVATRYFKNDVGNAALHWISLALEQQIHLPEGSEDTLLEVQYYRYW